MSVTKNHSLTVGFSAVIRSVLVMLCLSVCLSCQQPRRLHEHRNFSVALWSSEQTEPADAGWRDAGRSLWSTLLTSVCPREMANGGHIIKDLAILFLYMFLNK